MYMDESCEIAVNVEETSNGLRLSLAVPNAYFKYIIGKKGETKRRIEEETNTQIRIPRQGEEGNIGEKLCDFEIPSFLLGKNSIMNLQCC